MITRVNFSLTVCSKTLFAQFHLKKILSLILDFCNSGFNEKHSVIIIVMSVKTLMKYRGMLNLNLVVFLVIHSKISSFKIFTVGVNGANGDAF